MKKLSILTLTAFLFYASMYAQKVNWMDKNINSIPVGGVVIPPDENKNYDNLVISFLSGRLAVLTEMNVSLLPYSQNQSLIGKHYDYVQAWKGIEIYGSEVKINIANSGSVMSLFEKTISTAAWNLNLASTQPNLARAVAVLKDPSLQAKSSRQVLFINSENLPVAAWEIQCSDQSLTKSFTMVIDQSYTILYQKDNAMRFSSKDSTVRARVFLPDPLTTANLPYGISPYLNRHDSDVAELDSQMKQVPVTVKYEKTASGNDSFYLLSPYVYFSDHFAPGITAPYFSFTRNMPAFECINAYYHLNAHQQHLRKLGITNLCNYSLNVNAHVSSLGDNSQFIADLTSKNNYGNNILQFGTGGVPDAQDADVIIHEYSHAIRNSASFNTFNGPERMATEEGFCDYFACSYSKFLSTNQWRKCFNWDGDNEPSTWQGRTCATSKIYPRNLVGEIHLDGEIFSGSLMEIYDEVGRDTTDLLMLLTEYSLTSNMTMPQIAKLYLVTDSSFCKGRHAGSIICHFGAHGLMNDSMCKTGIESVRKAAGAEVLSSYFAKDGILYLRFAEPQSGRIALYSLDGKEIFYSNFHDQANLSYYHPELAAGLYILHISSGAAQQAIKLIKQ